MTLAEARARAPHLVVKPDDPAAEHALLIRFARWAGRYTPLVATVPEGLMLDLTGASHLVGGEAALINDIVARLAAFGFAARAGLADTPRAAMALARAGAGPIAAPGATRTALAPLPVASLMLPAELRARLDRLGLRRIGDLLGLARGDQVRLDAGLARLLDETLGTVAAPISPLRPAPTAHVAMTLAEPISDTAMLAAVLDRLLGELMRRLEAIGHGALGLDLLVFRVDGGTHETGIGLARPGRDARTCARLFAEELARIDAGLGIESVRLDAAQTAPFTAEQIGLAEGDGLGDLVDLLANRLGARAVRGLAVAESHVPERASIAIAPHATGAAAAPAQPRPPRLIQPEAIQVVAPLPDDPPRLFRWRGALHRIAVAEGPERILGEWWRGPAWSRDYWRVEDEAGTRFWFYRDNQTQDWFLHGLFG